MQNPDMRMTGIAYCSDILVVLYAEIFVPSAKGRIAVKVREATRPSIGIS
jgi:hypothetical protein